MNTYFFAQDGIVNIIEMDNNKLTQKLKPSVYVINKGKVGYYLSYDRDLFELPNKLYGNIEKKSERVKNTYKRRDKQLGVLLVGKKGSGKTLFAKYTANKFIQELGLPVILVNQPFTDSDFINTLNKIGECVIIFDEFQKVYKNSSDEDLQEKLLSFFDGVNSGKRLILVTENKYNSLNSYLLDRPSRFYYYFDYTKLNESIIKEVCEDLLERKELIPTIIKYSRNTPEFSFDILLALIEELNFYPEDSIEDVIDVLNVPAIFENEFLVLKLERIKDKKAIEVKEKDKLILDYNIYKNFSLNGGEVVSLFIGDRTLVYNEGDIFVFEDETDGYRIYTKRIEKCVLDKY